MKNIIVRWGYRPIGDGSLIGCEYFAEVKENQDQLEKMGLFFPNIFFLVAAVIIFISMSHRVELEQNQVGILKALGIGNSAILLHFLGFAVLTGVIGCVGLIMASLAMNDSMKEILNKQFKMINKYDISVALKAPIQSIDDVKFNDSNIKNVCKKAEIEASFKPVGKDNINTILNILPKKNEAVVLTDENNKPIDLPNDGIIISMDYADKYKIDIGDTMNIKLKPPLQKSENITAIVKGIGMMYLSQELYISPQFLNKVRPTVLLYFINYYATRHINKKRKTL